MGATASGIAAVVSGGKITDVKIISGGVGYADTATSVSVLPVGKTSNVAAIRPIIVTSFDLDQDEMAVLYPIMRV